jgi:L-iditol 2-dehydrogenase
MEMKAAIIDSPGKFVVRDVPDPVCADDGVLLRVGAATICSSDLKRSMRTDLAQPRPYILGEEVAGTIAAVGRNVTQWKVGQRVAFASRIYCGECHPCRSGRTNACKDARGLGWHIPGGFAEYVVVPGGVAVNDCLVPLPEDLPFECAALAEPFACALNSVEVAGVGPGDDVVIIGMGFQGVAQAVLAKQRGARRVIGVVRTGQRNALVRRAAPMLDDLLASSEMFVPDQVRKRTEGEGASVVFVSGSSGDALLLALGLVRYKGRICVHASIPSGEETLKADANWIHYQEITLTGSSSFLHRHYREALAMMARGDLEAGKFLTHKLPLSEVERGVELMKTRAALKVALLP